MAITYQAITNRSVWNDAIKKLPGSSILQTWEWGQVKSEFGWQPTYFLWRNIDQKPVAGALMLVRELPILGLRTIYIPQGPLLDWENKALYHQVIQDLESLSKAKCAFSMKIDPEVIRSHDEEIDKESKDWFRAQEVVSFLKERGFIYSSQQIQFNNTAWMDLDASEDALLSAMKQKTRYNIRLAGRKGVRIRRGSLDDIDLLYQMYLETSLRDGFIIRPGYYYDRVWTTFFKAGMLVPLIAMVDEEPVAGLMLFYSGKRSWYLYGMSTGNHREKMPNYLLQWEAIKISKKLGCAVYDLWGAPDIFDEKDDMWGVYRFKQGLGATPVQRIGAYDLPLKKNTYTIFIEMIPRIQSILRRRRKKKQAEELNFKE